MVCICIVLKNCEILAHYHRFRTHFVVFFFAFFSQDLAALTEFVTSLYRWVAQNPSPSPSSTTPSNGGGGGPSAGSAAAATNAGTIEQGTVALRAMLQQHQQRCQGACDVVLEPTGMLISVWIAHSEVTLCYRTSMFHVSFQIAWLHLLGFKFSSRGCCRWRVRYYFAHCCFDNDACHFPVMLST